MKKLAVALLALVPTIASANVLSVKQTSPAPGAQLSPGQVVRISWDVELLDDAQLTGCEQEIFLSLDGGVNNHYRLTQMMSPDVRSFDWVVPQIAAKNAVFDLRFGCAESEELFTLTPWNPQVQSRFVISGKGRGDKLGTPTLDKLVALPGETVNLSWSSSIKDLVRYQVLASFDQGSHFSAIGNTRKNSLAWRIPEGAAGNVIFRIVAHKQSGGSLSSPISVRADLSIQQ